MYEEYDINIFRMYIFGGWIPIQAKANKQKQVFLPEKEFKCTNSTACFNMGKLLCHIHRKRLLGFVKYITALFFDYSQVSVC